MKHCPNMWLVFCPDDDISKAAKYPVTGKVNIIPNPPRAFQDPKFKADTCTSR